MVQRWSIPTTLMTLFASRTAKWSCKILWWSPSFCLPAKLMACPSVSCLPAKHQPAQSPTFPMYGLALSQTETHLCPCPCFLLQCNWATRGCCCQTDCFRRSCGLWSRVNVTGGESELWNTKRSSYSIKPSLCTYFIDPLFILNNLVGSQTGYFLDCCSRELQARCCQTLGFDHGPPIRQWSPCFLLLLTFMISTAGEPRTVTEYR